METKTTLNTLTKSDLITAIMHKEKDALTRLLVEKYHEAKENGVEVKDFYYAPFVACSSEEFDMFGSGGLVALFDIYGYKTNLIFTHTDEFDIEHGNFVVKKDNFEFTMTTVEGMHDSLYADFVDAKTAIINKM